MQERRRAPRTRVDLPARFRIRLPGPQGHAAAPIPSRVYDLSESGVRLFADQVQADGLHVLHPDIPTSEHCLLEVEILGSQSTLQLQGRVVWYDRTPPGNPFAFQMGVEFLNVTRDLKKELQKIMRLAASSP